MKTAAHSGFTLIELLVAISIIAILSVIGFVSFQQVQSNAKDAKIKADLNAIKKAYETNYDPTLNGGQGGYKPLTDAMFASGKIPTQPNGSPYPCVVGPDASCASNPTNYPMADQGYQVTAVLSNGSTFPSVTSNQGTLTVSPPPTCSNLTTVQSCNVWKQSGSAAVPCGTSTIYINCADIPGSTPINCSGLDTGTRWAVPNYYTQPYGGSAISLNPGSQSNTIWQASHVDRGMLNNGCGNNASVNIQLHFPDT